jgi:4-hydroxybenzoate polyprenyltransferase
MALHYTWIRSRDRMACFRAFNHNNWVGGAIFAAIFIDFLIRRA